MTKKVVVGLMLIVIIYSIPAMAQANAPFSIEANNLTMDQAEGMVRANGQVKVEFSTRTLLADEIEIDLNTKDVLAIGNVTYIETNKKLQGKRLLYNYQTEEGTFFNTEGNFHERGGVPQNFAGEKIKMVNGDFELKKATLTSCQNPDAHYRLVARKATIYPGDKLIAKDVEVWLGDYHIFTYPVYKRSLGEDETPLPSFGYNNHDGAYMEWEYEHYINEDLEGDIDLKLASKDTDKARLDYEYDITDQIELNPIFDYDKDRENTWYTKLIFDGDFANGLNLDFDLKYDKKEENDSDKIMGDIQVSQKIDKFYWEVEQDYNKELDPDADKNWNYDPQLTLGMFNNAIGGSNLITNLRYRNGDILFKDDEEINRQDVRVDLWNDDYELSQGLTLDTDTTLWHAWYDTDDDYSAYKLGFDLEQELRAVTDIEFGYDYIYETGEPPLAFGSGFEDFDDFDDDRDLAPHNTDLGWRNYYDLLFDGHWIVIDMDHMLKWQLEGHRREYETGESYDYYGYETKYRYFLTDEWLVNLNYERKKESGNNPPIGSDNEAVKNEFNFGLDYENKFNKGGYLHLDSNVEYDVFDNEYTTISLDSEYRTKEENLAYWSVESYIEYDLLTDGYEEQDLELKRVYDCMEFIVTVDLMTDGEKKDSVEFEYEIKY
ncbi:LPS-assembly protein LptD [Selenihalanaerobacter shriftii]|uniref:LPS-assembly protein n=1 Tax=Selenihalanaerobacter shriftii TaxID=142842 RepID=A0A1T4KWU9_9FIRM|nr:LPS-assembly protein LptD [Selenihalanaerobacter shriftii]SJZ46925.1 LPS-assembly protein [Selenihalanaerobacter shriftii]